MKIIIIMLASLVLCSVSGIAQMKTNPKITNLIKEANRLEMEGKNSYELMHKNALAKIDSALLLDPTNVNLYYRKVRIQGALEQYSDAISTIDNLLKIKCDTAMAYTFQGYINDRFGYTALADEKYKLAIKNYDNQLINHPNSVMLMISRAILIYYIQGTDAGNEEIKRLKSKYPNDPFLRKCLSGLKPDENLFKDQYERIKVTFEMFK